MFESVMEAVTGHDASAGGERVTELGLLLLPTKSFFSHRLPRERED